MKGIQFFIEKIKGTLSKLHGRLSSFTSFLNKEVRARLYLMILKWIIIVTAEAVVAYFVNMLLNMYLFG